MFSGFKCLKKMKVVELSFLLFVEYVFVFDSCELCSAFTLIGWTIKLNKFCLHNQGSGMFTFGNIGKVAPEFWLELHRSSVEINGC